MGFDLEAVDADGAIREAGGQVPADTRAAFFRKAAVAGGGALSGGAIMGMLPALADARPSKRQDLKIVEFALTLEYLEAAFYSKAVDGGALSGELLAYAQLLRDHEQAHVKTLQGVIRSLHHKVPAEPAFDFQGTTENADDFINTSFSLENVGVRAYLGQAPRLKSGTLLGAAATIVTVEARHAAAAAVLVDRTPFNSGARSITPHGSFDAASSMRRILGDVKDTHFIQG